MIFILASSLHHSHSKQVKDHAIFWTANEVSATLNPLTFTLHNEELTVNVFLSLSRGEFNLEIVARRWLTFTLDASDATSGVNNLLLFTLMIAGKVSSVASRLWRHFSFSLRKQLKQINCFCARTYVTNKTRLEKRNKNFESHCALLLWQISLSLE